MAMNPQQWEEFMKIQLVQQQQVTDLLKCLTIQQQQLIGTSNTEQKNANSTSISQKIKNFANDKFNPKTTSVENFIEYFEIKCNMYGDEYKAIQKQLLITCLPPDVFHKIKTAYLETFDKRTYTEVKEKLFSFYHKQTTRFKALTEFWNCIRQEDQSMEDYSNKLKELSKYCGYEGELLERQLRDRFATGLNHDMLGIDLKQKWPDLKERNSAGETVDVTFEQIFAVAQSRELAENDTTTNNTIQRIQQNNKNKTEKNQRSLDKEQCKRCGKYDRHSFDNCAAKNHYCKACQTKGHFESCCLRTGRAYLKFRNNRRTVNRLSNRNTPGTSGNSNRSTSTVGSDDDDDDNDDDANVYKVNTSTMRCKKIDTHINGIKCTMDWDPGSIYSIISSSFWKTIGSPELAVGPKLRAYGNYKLKPKGLTDVTVEVQGQQRILPVVVIKNASPMLFGLQWSEMFGMNFPSSVYSIKTQTKTLKQIIDGNTNLFDNQLGEVKNYLVNIHVKPGTEPKHIPARPIKFGVRKNVEIELERLTKEGIIEQVDPNEIPVEWATPTVNVMKTNGQIRICGDYRTTINPVLITHTYPVPHFDHLRQRLAEGDKYSKIDLKDAYLQFKIAPESKKYLTISTHKGYFQYNRMPFGITTAPSIFQHFLEKLLEDIPNVAIYFDDIAITGKNNDEHIRTLSTVLEKLKEAGMKVNLKKCSFLQEEIEYLGHTINKHGVQPTKSKIEAILKASPPKDIKELRSFLGLVNFYERFIPHLHSICAELHTLTGQKQKWKWTDHENEIFEQTKKCIVKSKPLVAFNDKQALYLACDASEKGVGAVLYHKTNNIDQPIAFASRKLKPAESRYSVIDREALAIFFGIKKFDQFLRGTKFTLVTDHKPLIHILGTHRNLPKVVNNRLIRWALIIGSYDYNIIHTKGVNNIIADSLSRLPNPNEQPSKTETMINRITQSVQRTMFEDIIINEETIKDHTKRDTILEKVRNCVKTNWKLYRYDDNALEPFFKKRNELSVENKIIMWQGRIIIPSTMRRETLRHLHRGHPGISAMRALARFYVWWPTIEEDIDNYVKTCRGCQENRPNNPELPVFSWSIPNNVWERVHIDFAGPFQGKYWLVLCDALSKWIEIKPMNKTTTDKLCEELSNIFTTFGLPEIIVSDNGPQFTSEAFKRYCNNRGIEHIKSSPYHPRTNGLAERLVRTFKSRMASSTQTSAEQLRDFLFTYRNTPHNTTLKSPAYMMFGRQLNCIFDNARPSTKRMLQHREIRSNITAENQQRIPHHDPGSKIYVRTKDEPNWKPAEIERRTHRYSYVIKTPEGNLRRRHADHIRPRSVEEVTFQDGNSTPFHTPASSPSAPSGTPVIIDTPNSNRSPISPIQAQDAAASPDASAGLRRSTRTVRAPRRLIDELQ